MIEDFNRIITANGRVKIDRNETIRGGVNYSLVDRLREYYKINGYPSGDDYKRHMASIKVRFMS
jgi:hypothetical protein